MLIAALTYFMYRPAISGEFVLDDEQLTQNSQMKAPDGLYQLWFTTKPADYWPVTYSSFWLEWRLWSDHPTGYHVVNLVLHVIDVLLLWLVLRQLAIPGAFLAALIFAVHPVNVESVAWIAQRKNLLSLMFLLLSTFCYLKSEERHDLTAQHAGQSKTGPWYFASLMLFVLGMLSKGSVVILPSILLLLIWWRRTLVTSDFVRISPFFVVGGLLALLNIWFQRHGADTVVRDVTILQRILGAGAVVWFYLSKALAPVNLLFFYPQWNIQVARFIWWLPLFAVLAITAILVWQRNSWLVRPLLFAWVFFNISLMPVMGFTDVGFMQYSLVADHYQHIAIIGVIALIAAGWSCWYKASITIGRYGAEIVAAICVSGLAILSLKQSGEYHDPITLYEATLAQNPQCWFAHDAIGYLLVKDNRSRDATVHFQAALALHPNQPKVYNDLGIAQVESGEPEQGIASFQRALELDPNLSDTEYNWGQALITLRRFAEGVKHLQRAVELMPDNQVEEMLNSGQFQEMVKYLEAARQLDPSDVNAYIALALAYSHAGRVDESLATYQTALEMALAQHQTALAEQIKSSLEALRAQNIPSRAP
jgi:Flp pilus assembly protein TadD